MPAANLAADQHAGKGVFVNYFAPRRVDYNRMPLQQFQPTR